MRITHFCISSSWSPEAIADIATRTGSRATSASPVGFVGTKLNWNLCTCSGVNTSDAERSSRVSSKVISPGASMSLSLYTHTYQLPFSSFCSSVLCAVSGFAVSQFAALFSQFVVCGLGVARLAASQFAVSQFAVFGLAGFSHSIHHCSHVSFTNPFFRF